MFKRKRLFDRRDSYFDTGVPCGNPKRVQTGEVVCMPSAGGQGSSARAQTGDSMKTQGEEQLRLMAQKQLNTKLTLQELSSQHRHFTEAGQYKPVLKEVKGVMGLQQYESIAKGDERVERLRQCGLSDDQIRLQLGRERAEKGELPATTHRGTYGTHPDVEEDRLRAIDSKIKEKEASLALPDSFRGLKEISRQEMDIEKSMFRGTQHDSNTLTSLLTEKKSDISGDPNDPINHLPQLMADIEERAREKIKEKRRRRRRNRKLAKNMDMSCDVDESRVEVDSEGEQDRIIGCLTREEMEALQQSESEKAAEGNSIRTNIDSKSIVESSECDTRGKSGSGSNADCANNKDCVFVEESDSLSSAGSAQNDRKVLKGHIEFLPLEYIEDNRLSLEEIKKQPKFANYEVGSPSNVLYVKNLSPRSSERDLVSLFGRFQKDAKSPIVYRLMSGRMRGQAFVSFESSDVAAEAIQLVNGFVLHEKPVIVQFGRRTTA